AVDRLDLADEIGLNGIHAANAEDVVGDERAVYERVAFADVVVGMDAEVLAVGDEVLALLADGPALVVHGLHEDGAFAAAFLAEADDTGDLGHDGGFARAARLEDFGDAGQTARDVLRPADFARRLGEQRPGGDGLVLADFQVGLFGHVVEGQALAVDILDDD